MSTSSSRKIVSSWQLILLCSTGVILSIASGWTTWDGMRNFTKEPLLSLMITFGIQGVMLIAAWLIGESFAKKFGKDQQKNKDRKVRWLQVIAGSGIGIVLFLALGLLLITQFDFSVRNQDGVPSAGSWGGMINEYRFVILAGLLIALFLFGAGRDVIESYLQSVRLIIRNAVLWIMFLACMAASVFFSFDSLFTTIFSKDERLRAADVRVRSEVSGIVNELVELTALRQLEQRTALLNSGEWLRYVHKLDRLANELQSAPGAIDQYLQKRVLEQQGVVARRQVKLSLLENEMVQLSTREAQRSDLIQQLQERAARLETKVKALDQQIFDKDRDVIAKTAEAEAEAGGIGVTSRAGRGPMFLELAEQLGRLEEQKKNIDLQLQAYSKRLQAVRKVMARYAGEIAVIKAKLLQLRSQASTVREANDPTLQAKSGNLLRSNAQAALRRLKSDRVAFEQNPTRAGLDVLQSHCLKIVDLMSSAPILSTKTKKSACDPGKTHEVGARLYALNSGVTSLSTNCSAGKGVVNGGGVGSRLALALNCLQDARLLPTDSAEIRAGITALERNRDDMAHRFVVTTNAFSDGNRLAYLSLAIAVAIDALVFMSGLFGASAARLSASGDPLANGRTPRQVDAMIESALLPNIFDSATTALETIRPIGDTKYSKPGPEWTHEIDLYETELELHGRLQKILNAGVAMGAVRRDKTRRERYFLRSEFIESLNDAARRAFISDKGYAGFGELEEIVTTARRPDLTLHAETILKYLHPSSEKDGYSSQLIMSEVRTEDVETVRRFLDAVATLNCVYCAGSHGESDRVLVPKELYSILSFMSGACPPVHDELQTDPKVLLSDQGGDEAECPPTAPGGRRSQYAGSDAPSFGRRTAIPHHRSDTSPAGPAAPIVHAKVAVTSTRTTIQNCKTDDGASSTSTTVGPPANDEPDQNPKVAAADQIGPMAEHDPSASGRRHDQTGGSDHAVVGEEYASQPRRSASPPAETAAPVVRTLATETSIAKANSKSKVEKSEKPKPKTDRPRLKISLPDDTIRFD